MLEENVVIKNAQEESGGDSIEDYLAKLQNSLQNMIAEDSDDASLRKSQVVDTAASGKRRTGSSKPERVSRERIKRQEKADSVVVKEEKDDLEAELEEENPMYAAQARLARLERWHSLALGNRHMKLRQRLSGKAIRDQEREIEQLEKENTIVGRLKKRPLNKPLESESVESVGRIFKEKKI